MPAPNDLNLEPPDAADPNATDAARNGRDFRPKECLEATECRQGTPDKVELLTQRFAAGVELHHPDDPNAITDIDPFINLKSEN